MSLSVVLAVGLDSWLLTLQASVWRSAGYIVVSAFSIREAIDDFMAGDFDLVLMCESIPVEDQERLISQIRKSGSRTPVMNVTQFHENAHALAGHALEVESMALFTGMEDLLASQAGNPSAMRAAYARPS
ncbi:MAG TPA: hypothetical protein VGG85_01565 [Terracidiphilus sp.]|jgi:DNA-binding response OmpR family regulator